MSKDLQPLQMSSGRMFIRTQFCTKPQKPPSSVSLTGRTAIVTGSNSGIGLECCNQFLKLQLTHLIMAVRSPDKGENAAASLRKSYPNARIDVWTLDMLSYESIQAFAKRCEAELERLDVVVLNAALIAQDFALHKTTGHETMVQTNYLSTALLAFLLLPILKAKNQPHSPGRLTIVSSGLGLTAEFKTRFADPLLPSFDDGKGWDVNVAFDRYSTTKTLLLMFISKLSENVDPSRVIVNTVDPGLVTGTGLHRDVTGPVKQVFKLMKMAAARSLEAGAWTYVDAAVVKGKETHGSFLMDWTISPFHKMMYTPEGKEATERLWDETIKEFKFAGVAELLKSVNEA